MTSLLTQDEADSQSNSRRIVDGSDSDDNNGEDDDSIGKAVKSIHELLKGPLLLLECSLVIKKVFKNRYTNSYAEAVHQQDQGHEQDQSNVSFERETKKNDFLKRYVKWMENCVGPVEKFFTLTEMSPYVEKALNHFKFNGSKDAFELFQFVLDTISQLFVPLKDKVGKDTYAEMEKWFKLVYDDLEMAPTHAEAWRAAQRVDTEDHLEDRVEFMFFNHRSMFLYATHIVYLECICPGFQDLTLKEFQEGKETNVYKLNFKGNIQNIHKWQALSARAITLLYPDNDYQWATSELTFHIGTTVRQSCITNDYREYGGEDCDLNGVLGEPFESIHKYNSNLIKKLNALIPGLREKFVPLYGDYGCHSSLDLQANTTSHLKKTVSALNEGCRLVRGAEKQRRHYNRNNLKSVGQVTSPTLPKLLYLDMHLFPSGTYPNCTSRYS